ncbi:MAG: nitroreductase family protein [Anaerolineae bacterium]
MTDFFDVIYGRRSIRRYRPDPVPQSMIEKLLDTAVWAPSAHNRQPWRFAVITTPQVKQELAAAMGRQLRADLAADGLSPATIEKDADRSYQRITTAPLLILLCLSMADMDAYPDPARQQNEWIMAVQSAALAGQNLLLTAHALGLGACWNCAPLFAQNIVRETLDLPTDWQPQALITAGYPAETRQKSRRPIPQITHYL